MMSAGPLTSAAQAVRSHEVSPVEMVEHCLERISADNGPLNALVTITAEQALRDAASSDLLSETKRLPGVPLAVKCLEPVAGLPTTSGSLTAVSAEPARSDSPTVRRLRQEGAVVVGTTNSSEFGWEGHSWNRLYGASLNPWNPRLSPGGSSGGSAAALASGMVGIATAGDVGGSGRTPAAQCGILGLKPTNGLLPFEDQPGAMDQFTPAVMACHPADLDLLFNLLRGTPSSRGSLLDTPLEAIKVGRRLVGTDPVSREVSSAFESIQPRVEEFAGELGLRFCPDCDPCISNGRADEDTLIQLAFDFLSYFGREFFEEHAERLDPSITEGISAVDSLTLEDYLDPRRRRVQYREMLDEAVEGCLVITPTLTIPGLLPEGDLIGADESGGGEAIPQSVTNTNIHNWTGHPSVSIPAGVLPDTGIPFGILVTAPRNSDSALIDFTREWFERWPWPLTAPGYRPFWPA